METSGEIQHGSRSTYMNHKCRCAPCTKAASDYSKKWMKANPESVARSNKKWIKNNPEKAKARRDKYRAANKDKSREQFLNWKKNNPEKYKANKQRYRSRKINAEHGCITSESFELVILLNGKICVYCGGPYEHIDHIIPLSRGGLNCLENIVTSCAKCNMLKSNKLLENWLTDTIDIKTLNCTLGE